MSNLLENKVAIVTGGTRGIGNAIVKRFLEEGAIVAFTGTNIDSTSKAFSQFIDEGFTKVKGYIVNNSQKYSKNKIIKEIYEKFNRIDILVNNAGISSNTSAENYEFNEIMKIVDVNCLMSTSFALEVIPYMKEQNSGNIINISSMVSIYGQPKGVVYPASKGYINSLTKSLAREVGQYGIRVNAIAPGVVQTDMLKNVPNETISYLLSQIPLKRVCQPEEIANTAVFLASDMSSYISGDIINVDGGCVM